MTQQEGYALWQQISYGLTQIESSIPPAVLAELNQIKEAMRQTLMAAGGGAAFRASFQQLWRISLTQVRNVNLLRAMQPFLRPGLGLIGGTWARIEICSLAVTGCLASEIIIGTFLVLVAAIIVVFLLYLILKALQALWELICFAWHWQPQQSPQPMQTPKWGNLWSALNDQRFGPVYTINTGNAPSEIEVAQYA
jgi:hypothetical protein